MKVNELSCPTCGAPAPETLAPNQQYKCSACGSILVLTDLTPSDQVMCPQCKTLNADDRRFCTQCGATLKVYCPFCYVSNDAGDTHCRSCGANLRTARQRKKAWLAEERVSHAERIAAWKQAEAESRKRRLEKLLDDLDEPENHPMALYCINQFGSEAVEPLVKVLRTDSDPDARFGAAHALGSIGDPRAVPALIDALSDSEPAVRYWAVDALDKLHAQAAVEAIGNLLQDHHKGVRERAAEALKQIGGPQAAQVLKDKRKRWPFG
jgi:predicted nucleic acid-binding Zn ribbon protein